MKTLLTIVLVTILLATTAVNSHGDLSSRGYASPIKCTQVDCDKAYTMLIKQVNPKITSNKIKEILTALNKSAPKYFGTGTKLEVGKEMTLAIIAVEDGFKTGSKNIESIMTRLKSLLERYKNKWKPTILAYGTGREATDRLIAEGRMKHWGGYWDKVWKKKYSIHWKKGAVFRNKTTSRF